MVWNMGHAFAREYSVFSAVFRSRDMILSESPFS